MAVKVNKKTNYLCAHNRDFQSFSKKYQIQSQARPLQSIKLLRLYKRNHRKLRISENRIGTPKKFAGLQFTDSS